MEATEHKVAAATRICFLGARCADSTTMEEAIARIEDAIISREPHLAVALNVPKLWRMERDARLRQIVESAEMLLPERVVVLASRVSGNPLRAYIGNDRLTHQLLPLAAARGYRLFFLGTRPEALQRIVERARSRYPGLQIAGCYHGFFSDAAAEQVARVVRDSRPDILFVGMGTPRQEYWMEEWGRRLGVPVVIGVGGTLDVLAGLKRQCPDWIRSLGLEWVFRALEDPRGKFTRYCRALPWFAWTLLTDGIVHRCSPFAHAENRR